MLVVRVELWPGGDPRVLRQIAIVSIVNVGETRGGSHRYDVRSEGRIARVRHRRSHGALALVARALRALESGQHPDREVSKGRQAPVDDTRERCALHRASLQASDL